MPARKRSLDDMSSTASGWKIDGDEYTTTVLHLAEDDTEDALDQRLALEAHDLGLDPLPMLKASALDGLTASLSMTTVGSDSNKQSLTQSRMSQSTAPTSCSSSERRQTVPATSFPQKSPTLSANSALPDEKHPSRHSLRASIRKMAGFKRRKSSVDQRNSPLASIDGNIASSPSRNPSKEGVKTPTSTKSHASSLSNPSSVASEDKSTVPDEDALRRTMEAAEISALREHQLDERFRFLQYQRFCLEHLRAQHKSNQQKLHDMHVDAAIEMEEKNILAADDLESRQLQAEIVFRQELEAEKRTCLIRLRHMEAYCHSPSPPTTPQSHSSLADDQSDRQTRDRKVTDKDYHNLAAQYRERDNMDNLHKARIEVMQGRQEKSYNEFVKKKEKDLAAMVAKHEQEEAQYIAKCETEAGAMRRNFQDRGGRLQSRWKLQGLIETSKLEKQTNLPFAPPPDIPLEMN